MTYTQEERIVRAFEKIANALEMLVDVQKQQKPRERVSTSIAKKKTIQSKS